MYPLQSSPTIDLSLDEVIRHLSERQEVDGLIAIGSLTRDQLTPASDYDLILVMASMPVPLHVGLTVVDRRLTDLLFVTVEEVEQILAATEPMDPETWVGRTVDWLQNGQIVFDRAGRLGSAQHKVQTGQWLRPKTGSQREIYPVLCHLNYNVQHNKRLLASDDPVYLTALDVRLLYCLVDVFYNYFHFRGLTARGEKDGVRYLEANDPEFLALFKACLAETDRDRKMAYYEKLAGLAATPVGGLWPTDATFFQFGAEADFSPGMIETAHEFWQALWLTKNSSPTIASRIPGLNPGAIKMSDNFDDPLPDEFWPGTEQ